MLGFGFLTSPGSQNTNQRTEPQVGPETYYFMTSEATIVESSDGVLIEVQH